MEWLREVAKYHQDYVRMVLSFGGGSHSEDIVQETYLRLWKYKAEDKVLNNGEVSKSYMWIALRNTYSLYAKERSKIKRVCLDNLPELTDTDSELEKKIAQHKIDILIDSEVNTWHWYDAELYTLYRDTELSMRDIARETKISLSSVFNTINNCNRKIVDAIAEDYEDFRNGDYDKI
jgi:DNA-directed RNA polymerase specialized sigma24 family protein